MIELLERLSEKAGLAYFTSDKVQRQSKEYDFGLLHLGINFLLLMYSPDAIQATRVLADQISVRFTCLILSDI